MSYQFIICAVSFVKYLKLLVDFLFSRRGSKIILEVVLLRWIASPRFYHTHWDIIHSFYQFFRHTLRLMSQLINELNRRVSVRNISAKQKEKKKNENKLFDDNVITRSRVCLEFTFIFLHTYLNIVSGSWVIQDINPPYQSFIQPKNSSMFTDDVQGINEWTNELLGNWHNFSTWIVHCYGNRTFCALCSFTRDWVEMSSKRVPCNQPKNFLTSLCRLCNCWGGRKRKNREISRRFLWLRVCFA